jgi:uncharacterized membrane protein YhdT
MANLGTPTKFGTVWVIGLCAVVLIGWDIYAAMSPNQPTISALTLNFALAHPILPFLTGVLAGHLFWPQQVKGDPK